MEEKSEKTEVGIPKTPVDSFNYNSGLSGYEDSEISSEDEIIEIPKTREAEVTEVTRDMISNESLKEKKEKKDKKCILILGNQKLKEVTDYVIVKSRVPITVELPEIELEDTTDNTCLAIKIKSIVPNVKIKITSSVKINDLRSYMLTELKCVEFIYFKGQWFSL